MRRFDPSRGHSRRKSARCAGMTTFDGSSEPRAFVEPRPPCRSRRRMSILDHLPFECEHDRAGNLPRAAPSRMGHQPLGPDRGCKRRGGPATGAVQERASSLPRGSRDSDRRGVGAGGERMGGSPWDSRSLGRGHRAGFLEKDWHPGLGLLPTRAYQSRRGGMGRSSFLAPAGYREVARRAANQQDGRPPSCTPLCARLLRHRRQTALVSHRHPAQRRIDRLPIVHRRPKTEASPRFRPGQLRERRKRTLLQLQREGRPDSDPGRPRIRLLRLGHDLRRLPPPRVSADRLGLPRLQRRRRIVQAQHDL